MALKSDYSDNIALIREYRSGNQKALELLTKANMNLVISIAHRFTSRGYELEDLIQTGTIGLLKALEGFDESLGYSFSTYAFPLITGEIRRFIRDDGPIKISRSAKSNAIKVINAKNEFIKENLREPKVSELSEITSLSTEEITTALEISRPLLSLQDKVTSDDSDLTLEETVAEEDTTEKLIEKLALKQEIKTLDETEQKIISLRYFRNLTQTQTASLLGISQVTVSRSEKKIIDKLRQKFL